MTVNPINNGYPNLVLSQRSKNTPVANRSALNSAFEISSPPLRWARGGLIKTAISSFIGLSTLFFFAAHAIAQPEQKSATLYSFNTLSIESAAAAAWGALNECRKRGFSVAVAVVDRGGNLQALFRDRLAGPHTPETAIRKAWTANSFRQSTSELAALLKEGRIPSQVSHNPGALLVGGGLVIESQGEIVGGIGVSGAPPGQSERDSIDGACAAAGIETIRERLEFGN